MKKYMTVKDVAAFVQLTEQTIRRYVMLKQIPYHKVFRSLRFKRREIKKWVEENKDKLARSKRAENEAGLFDEVGLFDESGGLL